MSVQTTADEKIDLAEESVKDATLALSEVVIQECWNAGVLRIFLTIGFLNYENV